MFDVYPVHVNGINMPNSYFPMLNMSNEVLFASLNFSIEEAVEELKRANGDRWLNPTAENMLVAAYIVIGVIGVLGNLLLVCIIAKTPSLRTARNLYIANLAISDLTLSIICMPFTLIQLVKRDWPFGTIVCKMVPTFQATNVFVSTFSYSAIAVDRYKVIVYSSRSHPNKTGNFIVIGTIWVVALMCAIPMTLYTTVEVAEFMGYVLYRKCYPLWPSYTMSKAYTISVMVIQYLVPVVIVSVSYTKITLFLKYHRMSMSNNSTTIINPVKMEKARRRAQRTTNVLIAIAAVFAISWLPLNIYNLIADFNYRLLTSENVTYQHAYIAFAVCHAVAMSSACWNPILYGWLNTAMKAEILLISRSVCRCFDWPEDTSLPDDVFRSYRFNELSFSPSMLIARPPTSANVQNANGGYRTELRSFGNQLTVPGSARSVATRLEANASVGNGASCCADL